MNNQIWMLMAFSMLISACDSLPSWMGGAEKQIVRLPGDREDVLLADTQLKPDEILQQVSFKIPEAQERGAWTQATGQTTADNANLSAKGDFSQFERMNVGDADSFSHSMVPQPVSADGKLFAMDATGHISAHELSNIRNRLWVSEVLVDKREHEVMGGGLAIDGETLYGVSGLGVVAAMNVTDGSALWQVNLGVPLRSAPTIGSGKLFVVTIDSQLFALDVKTGATLWMHRGIGETAGLMQPVSPAIASNMVLVPYPSGEIYALNMESGDEVWRASLAQSKRTSASTVFSGIGGNPVWDDAVVFAVSNSGMFSAINMLNGQPVWDKKIASINTPWVVGEYVFVLSEENQLIAMVKYDGRIRWTTQLKRFGDEKRHLSPIIWRGPVMVNGALVLVSSMGEMVRIDGATGAITSTIDIADDVATTPISVAGKLFVVNKHAQLFSYQ